MSFYLARFKRNKTKYLTMLVIIGAVYFTIHTLTLQLPQMYAEINPEKVFDIENVYELKSFLGSGSILGIEENVQNKIRFDEALIRDFKNITGIHSACLLGIFSPFREIYGSMKLNDSIKNCMFYSLGEGFEDVLNLEISQNGKTASLLPEIYLESTLAEILEQTNNKLDELEVGDEKIKYAVNGTFQPLRIKDKISNNILLTGIQNISESDKILIRLNAGADFEVVEKTLNHLLISRYNVDQSSFTVYPLSLEGKEEWFRNRKQIVSFFIISLILLFYVMLALLGLYWNETKSRNIEIGILRAVGFTRRQVFGLFMKESTMVSVIAIVISQIIIINVNPKELNEPGVFFFRIFLSSLVLLGIVWLSVLIPAVKSSMIQPAQALSQE